MHTKFQNLRTTLIKNEKLFKRFLLGLIVVTIIIGIDKLFIHQVNNKTAAIGITSSLSSTIMCFLGFLNYRLKVGVHDMLVDLYENAPPPPKLTLVNMIKENSYFKPFKFKL